MDADPYIASYAAQKGFKYQPDADERWIRVWEPFATLKTPIRYEHTLDATGELGSLTVARFVVDTPAGEAGAWIAIVLDPRVSGRAAATCDLGAMFGEPLDLVTMPRRPTGDATFDHVFATFAPSVEELGQAVTPSLRKLVVGWHMPVHFEIRPGGFILAPVGLRGDIDSLAWLVRTLPIFGEKAAKQTTGPNSARP